MVSILSLQALAKLRFKGIPRGEEGLAFAFEKGCKSKGKVRGDSGGATFTVRIDTLAKKLLSVEYCWGKNEWRQHKCPNDFGLLG